MSIPIGAMNAPSVYRYRSPQGVQTVLLLDQDRHGARVVVMDTPIDVRRLPPAELRWLAPVETYPVLRAVRRLLEAGRGLGITRNARRALRAARGRVL